MYEQSATEFEWDCDDEEFEPIPYNHKQTKKIIAVVDCETDPFAPDFLIKPFAIGFETPDRYIDFWGDDCVKQFFEYLHTLEDRFIIYAHNGGKFDFFFFLEFMAENTSPRIINGRLVQIFFGKQEFRDSYAIVDIPLAKFQKDEIDYSKFHRDRREAHKAEIRSYLRTDCQYLFQLVTEFHSRFGDKLTAASAALQVLNSFHGFEKITTDAIDEKFRQYYFGGRVQCFESGELKPTKGNRFLVVDRNSMYPSAMKECEHPISATYELSMELTDATDFATITANSFGALPFRNDNGSLSFPHGIHKFFATGHEIRTGIETGTLEILDVECAWTFTTKTTFAEFVDYYYSLRQKAKAEKDKLGDIMYKLILNSSYGKLALNPRKFKSWKLTINEVVEPLASEAYPDGWTQHSKNGDFYIWERPSPRRGGFYNIATAASITGAARANLLRNLALAHRPIYCDTDSIICEGFDGNLNETELGGWKIEATGNYAAIAGKKLYAIFDGDRVLKKASKGCTLSGEEIIKICQGQSVTYSNPVPTFSFAKRNRNSIETDFGPWATFVKRNIRKTQ
jgi:DNA polymerase elongation subunit (family B)